MGIKAVMADIFYYPGAILQRHGTGVNVIYLDGSVEFREDKALWDQTYGDVNNPYQVPSNQDFTGDPATTKMGKIWASFDQR
jgi:prepilin-type processing-associated H-X9-DG protein